MSLFFTVSLQQFDLNYVQRLIAIQHVPVVLGGFVGTHADFNSINFFEANVILLIELPRILVVLDEGFKVIHVLFCFPSTSFDIPVQPLHQIKSFTSLFLHIQYFFDRVEFCSVVFSLLIFLPPISSTHLYQSNSINYNESQHINPTTYVFDKFKQDNDRNRQSRKQQSLKNKTHHIKVFIIHSVNMSQASPEMFQQYQQKDVTYFTIEGNIGCGKSTFLEVLKQRIPQLQWIEEPVQEWQQVPNTNTNMLERYYQQPKRWGFTFQIYAIFTRLQKMQEACQRYPQKIKISERSILADKFVFSQIMRELQYMDASEFQVFKSLYKTFQQMAPINEAKIIYLRCTPEKCYERTLMRKRSQQKEIPIEYLQMIHGKHEKWFGSYDPKKVLVIDTSIDFKGDENRINDMVDKLTNFIKEGSP